ncbi:unnamed protein product [Trifolium pratense]|uniref:Uncharacterized protein n=1 Tax=Trifolium pratense TaxID=57577 RepID=A0ACB0LE11_TRIPR|nr:unnamed protein product [Trifolium pratense]
MGRNSKQDWNEVIGRNQRRRNNGHGKIDIATTTRQHRENEIPYVTYFFTDFPDSFGANAMSNIFHKYGDIVEVVIPDRRDKRGRRFGFARFENVSNTRSFEYELDGIIIGRDKISVNISRFQREVRQRDRVTGDKGLNGTGARREERHYGKEAVHVHVEDHNNSYAQAVKKGVKNNDSHDDQGELGVYDNGSFNNSQFISSSLVNSVEKGTVSSEPDANSPVMSSNLNLPQERGMSCKKVSKGVMGCANSIANSKLNPIQEPIVCVAQGRVKYNPKKKSIGLIKENNIIHHRSPLYDTSRNKTSTGLSAKGLEVKNDKCTRNPVGKIKKPNIASNSVSSAGTILCCSSLQSSDIRNCNKVFLKNREKEVTSKIWKGARDLGVGGEEDEDVCIHHIHNNERRDEDGRILRAQQKKSAK